MHSKFTRLTLYNETTGIPFRVYDFSGGHKKLSGVVGFSNGVVCLYGLVRLSGVYHMSFYFWNPLFNKFVKHECLESLLSSRCTGFGYDSHSNDFKLVHVSEENDQLLARVYRISGIGNNNTWRISSVPLPRRVSKLYTHDLASVYVNGALNWMSREDLYILSFDMKDEVFQEFALPPRMIELYYAHSLNFKLTEFNGMLCVLPFWIECCIPFCVWVMKDYGKVESWTLLWEITLRDDPRISEEGPLEVEGWKNEGEDAWVVDAYSGQMIQQGCPNPHPLDFLFRKIRSLMNTWNYIVINHSGRNSNKLADALAHHGHSLSLEMSIF
ncbi:F-box/kelch-repeat protein [Senna tora]|uniref:F-box/kelch-repeat protein n=1 Tax=Senna tora TaxID=362788 RepID=A0A834WQ95_9FABA|nr:F-box/kelch-repeat protein [Senna tora]